MRQDLQTPKKLCRVVNLRAAKYDVYIGRGSIWGNPFSHLPSSRAKWIVGSREEAIAKYVEWFKDQDDLILLLSSLRGKRLGCYCKPKICHGDYIASLVNKMEEL